MNDSEESRAFDMRCAGRDHDNHELIITMGSAIKLKVLAPISYIVN